MRLRSLLLMLMAMCCALPTSAQSLAAPPFVRQWTQLVGDDTSVIAIEKGVLYYQSRDGVGAIGLATGTKKWSCLAGQRVSSTCLHRGTLYALVGVKQLYAIDTRTGSAQLLPRAPEGTYSLTQDCEYLYVLDKQEALHALSPRTGQTLWSTPLLAAPPAKDESIKIALVPTQVGIYRIGNVFLDFKSPNGPKGQRIVYGPDRQTARIILSPDDGGCIIRDGMFSLKKIDGEWFVVDWEKFSLTWLAR